MEAPTISAPSALTDLTAAVRSALHVHGTDLARVGGSARRRYEPANAEK
ncbi:hypothetical protein [Glycomyces harbinensis]|uniref:Uncharacterized protein n=1 Tax=Glycomyces harbinensis TaxID=58114 RepID=A0A1G6XDE0_9ACTN|nr:hypothetical protein [Glycomyces harbinensis]SDD75256.1 hypothetical protein SAMN05216270_10769 [Glycomyces harbinensis]